jgi:hypothetical protein
MGLPRLAWNEDYRLSGVWGGVCVVGGAVVRSYWTPDWQRAWAPQELAPRTDVWKPDAPAIGRRVPSQLACVGWCLLRR